jgi:hypothetical protein
LVLLPLWRPCLLLDETVPLLEEPLVVPDAASAIAAPVSVTGSEATL